MSSRYGRNQRREHRQKIAELEELASRRQREADIAQSQRRDAENRARTAMEDAMRSVIRQKPVIEATMERIGAELGRAMGPHFAEHVLRLKAADRERRTPNLVSFDAVVPMDKLRVSFIEGRVEPIHYRIAVSDW